MTEERKETIRIFKRRYGHYFIGILILLCIIALIWIGYHPQLMYSNGVNYENTQAREVNTDTLGLDDLDLSFEVTLVAFDGESFIYDIYFDHDITSDEASEINMRLHDLLESCPKDIYPGYISPVDIKDKNKAEIVLDLGNADTETMVTGIPESLNGMKGIEKIVINEYLQDMDT